MKLRGLQSFLLGTSLLLAGSCLLAQGRGPGGPGGGPPGGGGRPDFGQPGGGFPGGLPNSRNGGPMSRTGGGPDTSSSRGGQPTGVPPGRWWDDKSFAKSIGLRKEQQKKMDQVFSANRSAIMDSYNTLKKQQTQLDALTKQPKQDEARIFASIDAVAQARAALAKANAHMLLQVRQELDPEQVERLEKLRGTASEE